MTEQTLKQLDASATKAARHYLGGFNWLSLLMAAIIVPAWLLTWAGVLTGSLSILIAFPLIAVLTYAVYVTVLHEAAHGNISGGNPKTRWINNALGVIAGVVMFIPYSLHRDEHLAHHRETNKPGLDPDLHVPGVGPFGLVTGAVRAIASQFEFFFTNVWPKAGTRQRALTLADIALVIGSRVALAAAGFPVEALVLGVVANVAGVVLTIFILAWLVHPDGSSTERYRTTVTYIFPRGLHEVLTFIWAGHNYHLIHHLYPRVPFQRLPAVFNEIRPTLEAHGSPIREFRRPSALAAKASA